MLSRWNSAGNDLVYRSARCSSGCSVPKVRHNQRRKSLALSARCTSSSVYHRRFSFGTRHWVGLPPRKEQGAEMLLLNVILIPYSMALDDPAPAEEEKANHALEMGPQSRKGTATQLPSVRYVTAVFLMRFACGSRGRCRCDYPGVGVRSRVSNQWGKTSWKLCGVLPVKSSWIKSR